MKFKPRNTDRMRAYLQWAFANGIQIAARNWLYAGKPESDWSELYATIVGEWEHA
jgi:hypothetical protein